MGNTKKKRKEKGIERQTENEKDVMGCLLWCRGTMTGCM